jgi:hypothetical protein|tara:strand:+ start:281 stop:454 length:174 start_codon:yes stop_codon:yes gene_type:complete
VNTVYSLSINADSEIGLVAGNMYHFRIGALYDAPNSKFNYAKAVALNTLINLKLMIN